MSSEPAPQLVAEALGGRAAVRSGQVRLSLSLLAPGAREALTLRSAARFSVASAGATPSLALTLATLSRDGSAPAHPLQAALVSGPGGVSLTVQGRRVRGGSEVARALQAGYAQPAGASAAPLGLDAPAWLLEPRYASPSGTAAGGGAHVRAALAVGPFLADVARLAVLSAALQQAGGQGSAAAVARELATDATRESGAGTVDLYARPASRLPRSLTVSATLRPRPASPGPSSSPPLSVSLKMGFSDLGGADRAGTS
ncbi:MAG TPA: hypothetical protein VMB91_10115 [Solirubrobacteraceae bacterium]|nr:hypothetical protein [Solirubrobacteraceae bacterium]